MNTPSNILLLDGGISTELEHRQPGPDHEFPDRNLWSSSLLLIPEGRDDIQEVHESFFSAGSNIITTLTYQLSHYATKFGYAEEQIDDMLKQAIQIAKQAKDNNARSVSVSMMTKKNDNDGGGTRSGALIDIATPRYIVASIGCFGAVLADGSEYTGNYNMTMEELIKFHQRRVEILAKEKDVDGIAFETIPSLREVNAICEMMKSMKYDDATWLSLACKDGLRLNDGTPLSQALDVIDEIDPHGSIIHGIGVNCCKVQHVYELSQLLAARILQATPRRAIVIYPNSGEEWDANANSWKEGSGCTNPQEFASEVIRCIRGIDNLCCQMSKEPLSILVGGCCRTTPATIRALYHVVEEYKTERRSTSK